LQGISGDVLDTHGGAIEEDEELKPKVPNTNPSVKETPTAQD
jgi:hypothetical protein